MNILPIEFRVLGGMWCGDVVALNGSEDQLTYIVNDLPTVVPGALA
jgi:hypothetical protein